MSFNGAALTDATFTGADVRATSFEDVTASGFVASQLYSTASYQAGSLWELIWELTVLTGWNFAGQNLMALPTIEGALTAC